MPFVLGTLSSLPRRVVIRDAHSEQVPSLLLDGLAHVGFALTAVVPRGLRRVPLPVDPVVTVAAPDHAITALRRASPASLKDSLIALTPWGDGFEAFLARLRAAGVEDWRVRHCGDAATAISLASGHHHVALVARSVAAEHLGHERLAAVRLSGLSSWRVRLDLVHRHSDRNDPVVETLTQAIEVA